jgi:DNA-binding NarL/FixJ family response regulator
MKNPPIRVLIVDDHYLVRQGLVAVLLTDPGIQVIGEVETAEDAFNLLSRQVPDVILMDLNLPGMSGSEAIALLRDTHPKIRLIALTSYETEGDISRALDAGAHGYLLKTTSRGDLITAIKTVATGESYMPSGIRRRFDDAKMWRQLTPKEMGVLEYLAKGLSNKEIADQTGTKESTIKTHITAILSKLGASDRTEAVVLAISERVIRLD